MGQLSGSMEALRRIALIVVAVMAFGLPSATPSRAETDQIAELNKQIATLVQAKKYAEATPMAQRVLEMRERMLGPNHPETVAARKTLADIYRAQGRTAEANALEKRAQTQRSFELATAPTAAAPPPPSIEATVPRPQQSAPPPPSSKSGPPDTAFQSRSTRGIAPGSAPRPQVNAPSTAQSLPEFPWPPPAASASYVMPRNLFQSRATVGEVASSIVAALERTGYVERSFFRTQADGVALVTRLERINDDGTARAEGDRWPAALQNYQSASDLTGFFRGLFFVDRGRYRVIVFVLQDLPFVQSGDKVTGQDARAWLREGANTLPRDVANRPFGDGNCSVLVYEFASDGTAVKMVESHLTGRQHLEKAGVLAYFEKRN